MAGISPTQLSLRHLRELGFLAQVVEKWITTSEPGMRERREERLAAAGALESLEFAILVPLREHLDRRGLTAAQIEIASSCVQKPLLDASRKMLADLPPEATGAPGRRVDLFGLIDIICLDGNPGCLGVQACAYSGISAHVKEIRSGTVKLPAVNREIGASVVCKRDLAARWLGAGNRLQIFGWRLAEEPRKHWAPRIVEITRELIEREG